MYNKICIFKIKDCSLATDVVNRELQVGKLTENKGQFERSTETYSAKCCIRSRTKTIFAGELFGNKEIPCCCMKIITRSFSRCSYIVRAIPRMPSGLTC